MLPTLRRHWRGLVRRVRQRCLAARLAREIRWCTGIGGDLSLVLLVLPRLEITPETDSLLDRTTDWIAAAHPGAVVAREVGSSQLTVLLPGASLARAQQFCGQLRRATYGVGPVGEYLYSCAQGVAAWEPGISAAELWLRAESALRVALNGRAPVVLYHDALPRLTGSGASLSWEAWSL